MPPRSGEKVFGRWTKASMRCSHQGQMSATQIELRKSISAPAKILHYISGSATASLHAVSPRCGARLLRSFNLDVRVLDHLRPLLLFRTHECGELLGRLAAEAIAEIGRVVLHFLALQDRGDLLVQSPDNGRWSAGGNEDAVPAHAFDPGKAGFRHRRHAR